MLSKLTRNFVKNYNKKSTVQVTFNNVRVVSIVHTVEYFIFPHSYALNNYKLCMNSNLIICNSYMILHCYV